MRLHIVPQVSFNLFQDNLFLADRCLHRTNDPGRFFVTNNMHAFTDTSYTVFKTYINLGLFRFQSKFCHEKISPHVEG